MELGITNSFHPILLETLGMATKIFKKIQKLYDIDTKSKNSLKDYGYSRIPSDMPKYAVVVFH